MAHSQPPPESPPENNGSEAAPDELEGKGAPGAPADPLTEARAEVTRLKEVWMRTAADFDNFRKRSRRELEDARKAGREEILKDLLPVFDNLERGLQSAQQAADVKAVVDGLQMISKQFETTLGRTGVTKVPTIGKAFDPAVHEAIQQVETSDSPPGTIVAEVQPGYISGERLLRAAMVVVAKPKSAGDGSGAGKAGTGNAKPEN